MKEVTEPNELDISKDLEQKGEKLTDWKNEQTITDLKEDYNNAQTYHAEQVTKIDQWLDALEVRGPHEVKCRPGKSKVQPKLIKKQAVALCCFV